MKIAIRTWLAAGTIVLLIPDTVGAAGLGDLRLRSSLGQPLDAEIDLVAVRKAETITARFGSPSAYERANLEYDTALAGTRVTLHRRPDGRPYLRAVTPLPVNEPIVNLVVEMSSGNREVIARYTLLLDPPRYSRAAAPSQASAPAAAPVEAARPAAGLQPELPAAPAPAKDELALVKPSDAFPPPAATAEAALENPQFAIARYEIDGASRVPREVLDSALREFTGPSKDFSTIQSAVAAIEKTYADAGFAAVRVIVPEQDVENGVVRLSLVEARVGKVEVTGNKTYSEGNIRRSLPTLREGEIPNVDHIGKSLRLANESTTKNTQVTFTQAPEPMVVNATVRVVDAPTSRWAASLDNTGSAQTGRWRAGLAYQHTNLWDRDHSLGVQIVTSPEHPGDVAVIAASYRIPFYSLGGALEMLAGHSDVDSGSVNTPAGTYGIKGSGGFAGLHYVHLLPRIGEWDQRVTAGLDYRYYKNDVSLTAGAGGSLIPDFQTLPASLTYSGFIRSAPTEWAASIGIVQNIPAGGNGSTAAFQAPGGRQGAEAGYTLARYSIEAMHLLPRDWRLRGVLNGQQTSYALIPGEQFALGGIDSVRGFGERAVANDSGNRASLELYTPQLRPWAGVDGRLLAFVDAGEVRRNKALPGEITKSTVASGGVGLRLTISSSAQVRVDTAYVLDGDTQSSRGSNRTHARLLYLF